jgi:uncharacterized protein
MELKPQRSGDIVWIELASPDLAAARGFYEGLLGWTTTGMPMPGGEYLVFAAGGRQVGGGMAQDEYTQGQRTWIPYLLAEDVDALAARAEALGGRVLVAPYDIPGIGRMALLADTGGARFALIKWTQAQPAQGSAPGCFCWGELVSGDPAAAGRFYGGLFGWSTREMDMGPAGSYSIWQRDGADFGGMMAKTADWGEMPDHWMLYIEVEDVDACAGQTGPLGGALCVPPTDIPGVGRFCIVEDPAGGSISLMTIRG